MWVTPHSLSGLGALARPPPLVRERPALRYKQRARSDRREGGALFANRADTATVQFPNGNHAQRDRERPVRQSVPFPNPISSVGWWTHP
jgi:hypothetical protein